MEFLNYYLLPRVHRQIDNRQHNVEQILLVKNIWLLDEKHVKRVKFGKFYWNFSELFFLFSTMQEKKRNKNHGFTNIT